MAKAYQINDHYGIVLVDSGKVIPLSDGGLMDSTNPEVLLELLLAAAVELDHLRSQLKPSEDSMGPFIAASAEAQANQEPTEPKAEGKL